MRASWRLRFGFWLEQFRILRPLLLRYDGQSNGVRRYVNRVNGCLVAVWPDGSLR